MTAVRLARDSSGRPPWRSLTSTALCWRRQRRFCLRASSIDAAGSAARFCCEGLYHGLQHRFGRLDYGRLIAIGLNYISRIPVVELERIAYENFVEYVRPRLFEGVVDHLTCLRCAGTRSCWFVVARPGDSAAAIYLGCTDTLTTPVRYRARPAGRDRVGPACYGEGKRYWAEEWGRKPRIKMDDAVAYADNWSDRACWNVSAAPSSCTHAGDSCGWRAASRMGYRPAPPAGGLD